LSSNYPHMKKILITGGAGFIGSHLIDYLVKQGHEVICVDNFFSGKRENIEHHFKNPKFQLIKHDISLPFNHKIENLDQIYNLACPGSPVHYQFDPVKTLNTSVVGVQQMLELARQTGARLLQASTSEIYGDPKEHPQKETYWGNVNPIGIRANYDEAKRCAETLIMDYYRQYKTDIKIVRIFNTYGPNMDSDDGRVVSNFIIQALKNNALTIYGDGSQTRSFCYVDDLVDGLLKMMAKDGFQGTVNLGKPGEFTIKELAEMILKLIPESQSKIIYQALPSDDPKKRCPDISLAEEKLNWIPEVGLKEGLKKTIDYFRSII